MKSFRQNRMAIICVAAMIAALILSMLLKHDVLLRVLFIVIPAILIGSFTIEAFAEIKPQWHKKKWGEVVTRLIPYFLGITIGVIFIITFLHGITR